MIGTPKGGPLPPPPILTQPLGFLSWLGLKSGGVQPGQMQQAVQPCVEMTQYYDSQAGNTTLLSTSGNLGTVNAFGYTYTVPQLSWLRLISATMDGSVLLAACTPAIKLLQPTGLAPAARKIVAGPNTPVGSGFGFSIDGPILLPPGSTIAWGFYGASAITGTTFSANLWGVLLTP